MKMFDKALLLGALLGTLPIAGCLGESSASDESWAVVLRDDLVTTVDVTGVLRATRTVAVTPPVLYDDWEFNLVKMANEGSMVKKGKPVLWFNTTEIERDLAERQAEREAAAKDIDRKKADVELARRDGEMRLAETEAAMRKAALRAELPDKYTAPLEAKLVKLDLDAAKAEVDAARRRLEYAMKLGDAELQLLRQRYSRAQNRETRIAEALKQMVVNAPADGLVVYPSSWRGEKKKIGDECWVGEACIELVDPEEMMAKGEVDEMESARVKPGQPVTFRLEATPEIEWKAVIDRLRPNVYRQSPRNPLKVVGVDLKLDASDGKRMRPGMIFRGKIETGRVAKALLVPLEAVFVRPEGPVAFRRAGGGLEKVVLKLGARNDRVAEVLGGLKEGDRLSKRDPDLEGTSP